MDGREAGTASVRWSELAWPEIDALDRDRTVLLLPTGSIEQHGHHLPVDTDIHDAYELSLRAAAASSVRTLVLPPVWWGDMPHHMGYPGTISLPLETYSALIRDICAAVARHGFRRVLVVNGHGGNSAILGATSLRISEELGLFVGVVSYWQLIGLRLREIGTSELGGMGHACEMETSLQLHLRPERVSMADARKDLPRPLTSFSGIDFRDPGPLAIALDFRRDSIEGVMGDPTGATVEKGVAIAEAVLEQLARVIEEFRNAPLGGSPLGAAGLEPDTVV
jgi:creatinine amidohydrolase